MAKAKTQPGTIEQHAPDLERLKLPEPVIAPVNPLPGVTTDAYPRDVPGSYDQTPPPPEGYDLHGGHLVKKG